MTPVVAVILSAAAVGLALAVRYCIRSTREAKEAAARRTPEEAKRDVVASIAKDELYDRRANRFYGTILACVALYAGHALLREWWDARVVRLQAEHEAELRAEARVIADEILNEIEKRGRANAGVAVPDTKRRRDASWELEVDSMAPPPKPVPDIPGIIYE